MKRTLNGFKNEIILLEKKVSDFAGISFRKYQETSMITEQTVITIEPGLYIEGKWGIRFENVYEVSSIGSEKCCLTS